MCVIREQIQADLVGLVVLEKPGNIFRPFNGYQVGRFEEFVDAEAIQFMGIRQTIGVHVEELPVSDIGGVDGVGGTRDGRHDA